MRALVLTSLLLVGCGSGDTFDLLPFVVPDFAHAVDMTPCGCDASLACCATGCADTAHDVSNCGGCGVSCAAHEACVDGACYCEGQGCLSPAACCPGIGCRLLLSDATSCGACGAACPSGAICVNGGCIVPGTDSAVAPVDAAVPDLGAPDSATPGFDAAACACDHACLLDCIGGCCTEDVQNALCTPNPLCLRG
jgi:hypothetical protein